ncbi:EAL domain-containing protein [Cohnella massiliensis]|uniref:EAL domain-containing protein n=1 Tax=Cohnella massiliensis TaxID=1816691 RepID=UPI0009BB666D|nr:EAL domain-containing protein [Cohnella massiliensis]
MTTMENLITQQDFYHLFQPVLHLADRSVLGYEALIRCDAVRSPDLLFKAAAEQNKLFELDTLSVYSAIAAFFADKKRKESGEYLFLNVFPSSLADGTFPHFIEKALRDYLVLADRIVFEINETVTEAESWDDANFIGNLRWLRESGFLVAFDDVGEGATTLRKIIEIAPDMIKLDRFFGRDLQVDAEKRKMLKLFAEYCKDNTLLILEGIEETEDLMQAQQLGVALGQGFLLSKPKRLADLYSTGVP